MIKFIKKRVKSGSEFINAKTEPHIECKPTKKKVEKTNKTEEEIKDKNIESHGRKNTKSDGKSCE